MNAQHRQGAALWACEWLNRGCLIIDLETTGVNRNTCEPIQVGIIDHLGEVLLDTYVQPDIPINEDSQSFSVHGITQAKVETAPSLTVIWPRLHMLTEGSMLIAYNVSFERDVLNARADVLGLPWLAPRSWTCAMSNYSRFLQLPGKFGKYKNPKLPGATHGAIGDCHATLKIMQEMAAEGGWNGGRHRQTGPDNGWPSLD